ncbi:MAG: hypothetical protein IT314_01840 [Anaerolineales bacterium]|nr:hypothetical protein [Anaerolineales bacterium]
MSGAKAAWFRQAQPSGSALGSHFDRLNATPSGWRNESASADFHELRQGFIPPKHAGKLQA